MAEKKSPKKTMSKKSMKKTKGGSFSFGAPTTGGTLPAVQLGGEPGAQACCEGKH